MAPLAQIAIDAVAAALDKRARENREYLVDVLADEVQKIWPKLHELQTAHESHRRFMSEEMPGLVLDALRRAESTRAKDRITRLAQVIAHAADVGPRDGADAIEEMLSLAVELSELDVIILRAASSEFAIERASHQQEAIRAVARRAWERMLAGVKMPISQDELVSVGAKLEGFGLVVMERNPWEAPAYRPLERAYKLLEYIQGAGGPK